MSRLAVRERAGFERVDEVGDTGAGMGVRREVLEPGALSEESMRRASEEGGEGESEGVELRCHARQTGEPCEGVVADREVEGCDGGLVGEGVESRGGDGAGVVDRETGEVEGERSRCELGHLQFCCVDESKGREVCKEESVSMASTTVSLRELTSQIVTAQRLEVEPPTI